MKKLFLLSAALLAVTAASAQEFDVYVIGSNVNGFSWKTAEPSCKMTYNNGVYEWDGQELGSGFKFNDGTWADDTHNWGASEGECELGVPYVVGVGGGTSNISFADCAKVTNPHVVFDPVAGVCTVTGTAAGAFEWFLVGDFNNYAGPAADEGEVFKYDDLGGKIFELKSVEFTDGDTTIKIANTGWSKQYGDNDGTIMWGITNEVEAGVFTSVLQQVGSDGTMPCYLFGTYSSVWDLNNLELTFREAGNAVNTIESVNGEAAYFNMQGVKVNAPENGIFIKVANGKATKVAIR